MLSEKTINYLLKEDKRFNHDMAVLIMFFLDFLVKCEPKEVMSKTKREVKRADNVKLWKSEKGHKNQWWYNGLLIFLM